MLLQLVDSGGLSRTTNWVLFLLWQCSRQNSWWSSSSLDKKLFWANCSKIAGDGSGYNSNCNLNLIEFRSCVVIFNLRRMREGYGSPSVSEWVSVSAPLLAAIYLVYEYWVQWYKVPYGVLNACIVWISLKTLCSPVMASFAHHRCLSRSPTSCWWTEETAMGSYHDEVCLRSAIAFVKRPIRHCSMSKSY